MCAHNPDLGSTKRRVTSRSREVILPFYPHEHSPGVLHPDLGFSAQERNRPAKGIPEKDHEDDERDGAETFGTIQLEKRRLQGDHIAFQYQKGTYKKAGEELFTRACNDRTRGNDLKLKEGE